MELEAIGARRWSGSLAPRQFESSGCNRTFMPIDIIKNKTKMTVEEASKLRNGHGKNLNGGK